MEALELIDLIALGETSTVQFKRTLEDTNDLAKELCAFANTSGGMILFGVEDNGTITGLTPEQVRELTSKIANVASQVVREPVYPTSEVVAVNQTRVLVIRVPDSAAKPHFDRNGAIWVKALADKRRVTSREELRRMFQDAHIFYADEQPVSRSSAADLDVDAIAEFHKKATGESLSESGLDMDRLLENHNVAIDGCLTLAGLMFFGLQPQKYRPELVTKAVSWKTCEADDNAGYFDSEDIGGTLPQQLAGILAFIRRNLNRPQGGQSVNSEGVLEIPEQVFEELLVNMLVHRNYFLTAPQTVFVFPDRIEIASPGHLPNKLTVEQAKSGNSIPRNPILQSMAAKLMPYRGIGTGIPRALKAYPHIEFYNDPEGNRFRSVILRRASQV
jgi:predicted HTH transcriptional regulator